MLFCQTSGRISRMYTHVPSLLSHSPSHPSRLSRSRCLSSPSCSADSHCYLFYTWCTCLRYRLHTSHPLPPCLPHPWVCPLCLFLHCCSENNFISTIFLDSIYMCWYTILIFLFLTSCCIIGSRFIHLTDWVVFHFMYVPQLLYPFVCWWTSWLLPYFSYCK